MSPEQRKMIKDITNYVKQGLGADQSALPQIMAQFGFEKKIDPETGKKTWVPMSEEGAYGALSPSAQKYYDIEQSALDRITAMLGPEGMEAPEWFKAKTADERTGAISDINKQLGPGGMYSVAGQKILHNFDMAAEQMGYQIGLQEMGAMDVLSGGMVSRKWGDIGQKATALSQPSSMYYKASSALQGTQPMLANLGTTTTKGDSGGGGWGGILGSIGGGIAGSFVGQRMRGASLGGQVGSKLW